MNGTYYPNPTFPNNEMPGNSNNYDVNIAPTENNNLLMNGEQSYIENILRLNKGKTVRAYVSFPDATEWRNKIFEGVIQEAGRDHLILSNPNNGEWYLILMIYLNYVTFTERITYSHDFSEKTF